MKVRSSLFPFLDKSKEELKTYSVQRKLSKAKMRNTTEREKKRPYVSVNQSQIKTHKRENNLSILNIKKDESEFEEKFAFSTTYKPKFKLPENFKPLKMRRAKAKQ